MTFSILDQVPVPDDSDTGYNSKGFRIMLQAHLQHLQARSDTSTVTIVGAERDRYVGDLGAWCTLQGYGPNYHWIVANMNGYRSPDEYDGTKATLRIPNLTYIDELLQRYQSTVS